MRGGNLVAICGGFDFSFHPAVWAKNIAFHQFTLPLVSALRKAASSIWSLIVSCAAE